ncbi:MAG: DUF6090 family protein [Cryomorphaceae bacterium]
MIKFFRHIRQRMIKENRVSKYMLYAIGEIVLVVIGILIALQINNWNEDRKIRKSEQEILTNLKSELILNRDRLDKTQQLHHMEYDAGVQLLNLFNTDVSTIPVIKLDSILTVFEMAHTVEANDGYIKSLLSSGKIDHIQNAALKAFVGSFDGQVIDATEEQYPMKRLFEDRLWPLTDGKINAANRIRLLSNYSTIPKGTYESNYVWFFESREIEDIVSNILAWRLDLMDDEKTLLDNINQAIRIIDEELKR